MKDWVVLRPARYGQARFDTTRQTLIWPVFDHHERQLDIELAYSDMAAHAIARIEQIQPEQLPAGTLLVATLRNGMGRLRAEPLSLVRPHAAIGEAVVDALYFDEAPDAACSARVQILQQDVVASDEPSAVMPRALREVRDWVQRQAERGVTPQTSGQALARIAELNARTGNVGMTMFGKLAPGANVAGSLLRMHYVCMQYERLLDGGLDNAIIAE